MDSADRTALFRAGELLTEVFLEMNEKLFSDEIVDVWRGRKMLVVEMEKRSPTTIFVPFEKSGDAVSPAYKSAILSTSRFPGAVVYMNPLYKLFLKRKLEIYILLFVHEFINIIGILDVCDIEEAFGTMSNAPLRTIAVSEQSVRAYQLAPHIVLKVTLPSKDSFVLDTTSARYGISNSVEDWDTWKQNYTRGPLRVVPSGTMSLAAEVFAGPDDFDHRRAKDSVIKEIYRSVAIAAEQWLAQNKISAKEFLDLPKDEFEAQKRDLREVLSKKADFAIDNQYSGNRPMVVKNLDGISRLTRRKPWWEYDLEYAGFLNRTATTPEFIKMMHELCGDFSLEDDV